MITMEEVNARLEVSAQAWEKKLEGMNPLFDGWPDYYRGLKNFTSLDSFSLSSAHASDSRRCIHEYIKDHNLIEQYEVVGFTGGCVFTKIK